MNLNHWENYNLYSVMGHYIDKENNYFVEENTPKLLLLLYNPNNEKNEEFKFKGIALTNFILTDIIVDYEGQYAYITDS